MSALAGADMASSSAVYSPPVVSPLPDAPLSPPAVATPGDKTAADVKEDSVKSEKWTFIEPQPIREDQVRNAVNFLSHPKVRGSPIVHRRSFLERKGLTREEIDEAFRRVPDPPSNEGTRPTISTEAKVSPPAQTQIGVSPQPPSEEKLIAPRTIVQTRPSPHWSQLILGASVIAAVGAGTGYLFQRIIVPKMKTWLRDVIKEENGELKTEAKGQVLGNVGKSVPLEEALAAAAAAANAASVAASEMATTSREMVKSRTEEWQQLRGLIKSIELRTEELRNTCTDLYNLYSVSNGSVKALQHKAPASEHIPIKSVQTNLKAIGLSNGSHMSNGSLTEYVAQSDGEPWWRRKKVETETYAVISHEQNTIKITEIDNISDNEAAIDNNHVSHSAQETWYVPKKVELAGAETHSADEVIPEVAQIRGSSPLGRQGWVPPPVPQTVLPGAFSAIRYKKPTTVEDSTRSEIISEEKEMDPQTVPVDMSTVDKEIRSSATKDASDGIDTSLDS